MPASSARSMMAKLSGSVVCGPKFIVPRHRGLTRKPERPSGRWFISIFLPKPRLLAAGVRDSTKNPGCKQPGLSRDFIFAPNSSPHRRDLAANLASALDVRRRIRRWIDDQTRPLKRLGHRRRDEPRQLRVA